MLKGGAGADLWAKRRTDQLAHFNASCETLKRDDAETDPPVNRRTLRQNNGPAEKPTDQTRPYPFGDAPRGRRSQSMEPRRSEKSAVRRSFVGSSSMETSSPSELHRGTHQFG